MLSKSEAKSVAGTCTENSKMPCKTYNLPTVACITGFKMAQIEGSLCSQCYANSGFHAVYANTIEPLQHARLDSVWQASADHAQAELWVSAIVTLIGNDRYFRWHSSGDLQSVEHLALICEVAMQTPNCQHWLPTREYGIVKDYIAKYGALPCNLVVRLSAMYPDKPVNVPTSLRFEENVFVSNVHDKKAPIGLECQASSNNGSCGECRACWYESVVSYKLH